MHSEPESPANRAQHAINEAMHAVGVPLGESHRIRSQEITQLAEDIARAQAQIEAHTDPPAPGKIASLERLIRDNRRALQKRVEQLYRTGRKS